MPKQFPEENKHLEITINKLKQYLNELNQKVESYEKEFKESKKYLYENRSNMDAMEIFSNEKSISQIINSGEFISKQKTKIKSLLDTPYFARIDFRYDGEDEVEKVYIGRNAFIDDFGDMLIYDWRAPISSMYYDFELGRATFDAPIGTVEGDIELKRQFKISKSKLDYVLDSALSIGDEILQRELSSTSDQRMKNIVATIQKEQNKIIRNEKTDTLIIQGVAGSGKTSIALHRVAYFLYKYRDYLSAENIVIISPNKVFADYISNVLPELGEEPIIELDLEDIASEQLDKKLDFEKFTNQVSKLLEDNDKDKIERVKFKSSLEFVSMLDEYINHIDVNYFKPNDFIYNSICIDKEFIDNRYNLYIKRPVFERIDKIVDDIIEKIKLDKISDKQPSKKDIKKKIISMFKYDNSLDLYKDFFQYINRADLFRFDDYNKLENCDVFPYIYLKAATEGVKSIDSIKHVVIDEMQDYTPIQYMTINKIYKCKKTIFGDFGQCVNPYNSNSLELLSKIFDKSELVKLDKSYRSTYEIIKFAQKILKQDIDPIKRHGDTPSIIKCEDLKSQINKIEAIIDKFNESSYSTMGIICKTTTQAKEIYNQLIKKYDVNLLDFDSLEFKEGITISTIHMSKGLEFDEIIIPMADSKNYNTSYDRNLLYIACTRAMHKLTLTYHNDLTKILN